MQEYQIAYDKLMVRLTDVLKQGYDEAAKGHPKLSEKDIDFLNLVREIKDKCDIAPEHDLTIGELSAIAYHSGNAVFAVANGFALGYWHGFQGTENTGPLSVGKRIKEHLIDISVGLLADDIGADARILRERLEGRYELPFDIFMIICKALNVPTDTFL